MRNCTYIIYTASEMGKRLEQWRVTNSKIPRMYPANLIMKILVTWPMGRQAFITVPHSDCPLTIQWPFQEPKLELWPYMVQYLHFRILDFPLNHWWPFDYQTLPIINFWLWLMSWLASLLLHVVTLCRQYASYGASIIPVNLAITPSRVWINMSVAKIKEPFLFG